MKGIKTSWRIRRLLMFIVTAFCMTVIWRIVDGSVGGAIDTETARTALKYSYWVIFSVLVIYVFGVISDEQIARFLERKFDIEIKKEEDDKK